MDDKVVVLRVALDEGKTNDRLKQLVKELEQTKTAQAALTRARAEGVLKEGDYEEEVVRLTQQLKAQRTEQSSLQKNLELYKRAVDGVAGSYDQTQAQLSLAQRQYQQLAGSADNSTEATQALSDVIDGLRNTLKATDAQQSLFVRNVGNYPKGDNLESLVRQLVELQEQTKNLTAGTEEAARAQMRIVGFQTQAAQAGAKEGKTFEETTNFIKEYGEAIRPATRDLVALTEAQQQAAESGEATGEAMAQIGFKIGAAQKSIQEATDALKEVPAAAAETGSSIATALGQAGEAAEVLGVDIGGIESGFTRAKKGIDIAKGAFGSLGKSMLAIPIFALLAAFTALVAYFTKTREGANQLETVMAKVGSVFDVIIDRAGLLGKAVAQLFTGNFKAAAETARQSYRGIGDEMAREIKLAGDLSKARQQLERDEINNIDTNKRLLNEVERLKNVRDNEFNSIGKRKAANEAAYKVELEREKTLTDLAKRKADLLLAEINRRGGLEKATNEELKSYKEAQNEISDLAEDAAGKQNELITNRFTLEQERIDKSIERQAQAFALEAAQLNKQLAQVQLNSNEELSLLQQKLRNGYRAELNVKDLTVAQKKAIDLKYEQDSLALSQEFANRRILADYEAEIATIAAELTVVQKGTEEETALRREAIDAQLRKELAALDQRKDNAAQEALLRANAAKSLNDLNYEAALKKLDAFLTAQRDAVEESNARGKLTEKQYNEAVIVSDQIAFGTRLQLARDYKQDTTAIEKEAAAAKIAGIKAVTAAEKAEQAKRVDLAQQLGGDLAALFAQTVATTGATLEDFVGKALILIIDSMEKTLIAAQVKIIAEALATPQSAATFGVAGFAQAAATIAAVTVAAEVLKTKLTPSPKQFADGTVLGGASHANGGVQLFSPSGFHYGEAERDEIVLTAGVYRSPLLRPIASMLNVMGGGRPLVPSSYLSLGGIASPLVREQLRGGSLETIDYGKLAAAMSHLKIETKVSNIKRGFDKDAFDNSINSF